MTASPVFTGHVDRRGKLQIDDPVGMHDHLLSMVMKPVEIIVRLPRRQRSLNVNAYWHAAVFPLFAEHFGDTIAGVKFDLMGECWGWTKTASGHVIPVIAHTSDLSVEQATKFTDWLIQFGAENGIRVPLPGQVDISQFEATYE